MVCGTMRCSAIRNAALVCFGSHLWCNVIGSKTCVYSIVHTYTKTGYVHRVSLRRKFSRCTRSSPNAPHSLFRAKALVVGVFFFSLVKPMNAASNTDAQTCHADQLISKECRERIFFMCSCVCVFVRVFFPLAKKRMPRIECLIRR